MSEIKVGSEWIGYEGVKVVVKYIGKNILTYEYEDIENSARPEHFLTRFKPAPVRLTVWLNVYEGHAVSYNSKQSADLNMSNAVLFQQEVELIDPREGEGEGENEKRISEVKWTQGKWSYGGSVEQVWGGVIESCGYHVASAHGKNDDECKANAHLIAAAPDLYEALEATANSSGFQYIFSETRDKINAALVKARGETQA